jgi:hypothetical protein
VETHRPKRNQRWSWGKRVSETILHTIHPSCAQSVN